MENTVTIDWEKIDEIIEKYNCNREALLMVMQDISDIYNYVPPDVVSVLVDKLGVRESLVFSVATFYKTISSKIGASPKRSFSASLTPPYR